MSGTLLRIKWLNLDLNMKAIDVQLAAGPRLALLNDHISSLTSTSRARGGYWGIGIIGVVVKQNISSVRQRGSYFLHFLASFI